MAAFVAATAWTIDVIQANPNAAYTVIAGTQGKSQPPLDMLAQGRRQPKVSGLYINVHTPLLCHSDYHTNNIERFHTKLKSNIFDTLFDKYELFESMIYYQVSALLLGGGQTRRHRSCQLAPQKISVQINLLEETLGEILFTKVRRNPDLTETARTWL